MRAPAGPLFPDWASPPKYQLNQSFPGVKSELLLNIWDKFNKQVHGIPHPVRFLLVRSSSLDPDAQTVFNVE